MELLNNIWTFLNTPNEEFLTWMSIPVSIFVENPLVLYMFIYALNLSANKKQKLSYIVLMSLVSIFSTFVIPSPFNVIFNYSLMFILIWRIFKLSIFKSFVALIIPVLVCRINKCFIFKTIYSLNEYNF